MASQSPDTSAEGVAARHVPYLLLAEFDLEEGSVVRHQYPEPFTDEPSLADLMLPDGAHLRSEDWTTFYLPNPAAKPLPSPTDDAQSEEHGSEERSSGSDRDHGEGKLLFVINLVRTKKDDTVKRGALVKALAICSTQPYTQIFKPLLLLALDAYFNDPTWACLGRLYESVNAIDLTAMPRLSRDERLLLRATERKDLFEEKFPDTEPGTATSATAPELEEADRSSGSADMSTELLASSRNGSMSSADDVTREWVRPRSDSTHSAPNGAPDMLRRPSDSGLSSAIPSRAATPGPGNLSSSLNGGSSVPVRRPRDTHFYDTRVRYGTVSLPIRVPVATFPEEVGDYSLVSLVQTFSTPTALSTTGPLHPHLHTSGLATPPIILLFNALVTGKRIIFLGSGQPAGAVANHVLAACALASGGGSVLRGFAERAFPYSHLANLDRHEAVQGYIAGVTNPLFEDLTARWDVLCNIETGKISISKDLRIPTSGAGSAPAANGGAARPFSPTSSEHSSGLQSAVTGTMPFSPNAPASDVDIGRAPAGRDRDGSLSSVTTNKEARSDSFDLAFMEEILAAIQAHDGEAVIRARCTDYVNRFVRLASKFEEETFGSTSIGFISAAGSATRLGSGPFIFDTRELALNQPRIEGWRATQSYQLYRKDYQEGVDKRPIRGIDLAHQIGRLRTARRMPPAEAAFMLRSLCAAVRTEEQVIELLTYLPPHMGGLLPLAFGLFHPLPQARDATVDLFLTIGSLPVGRKYLMSLNAFHRLAFTRLAQRVASPPSPQVVNGVH